MVLVEVAQSVFWRAKVLINCEIQACFLENRLEKMVKVVKVILVKITRHT